jgi:flagellar biosynthetic protein FlhB
MEDRSSKTEQATPRQEQRVRDEGKAALSKDVIAAAVMAASGAALWVVGSRAGTQMLDCARLVLGHLDTLRIGSPQAWVGPALDPLILLNVAVGGAAVLTALASGLSQTHGLFAMQSLLPNFERLNPLPKLQQMFVSKQALLMLLQTMAKVILIGSLAYDAVQRELRLATDLWQQSTAEIASALAASLGRLTARMTALLVIFAAVDYLLTRRRFAEDMKMTKQEVRQDFREQDGDPEVKRRQRGRALEIGRRRTAASVAKADVLVVNPTHYAVALKYEARKMRAPRVVAKGRDDLAQRMREIAREHRVPLMHNPPLARALHAQCKVDAEVPAGLYQAVAELLAWAYRLRGGARAMGQS